MYSYDKGAIRESLFQLSNHVVFVVTNFPTNIIERELINLITRKYRGI